MPFMTGNVVSKWLRKMLCNLELAFVFKHLEVQLSEAKKRGRVPDATTAVL